MEVWAAQVARRASEGTMIYKFKSKAAGDVIMLGPNGDRVLALIGKTPAPQGIIECAAMPAAMAALQTAIGEDDTQRAQAGEPGEADAHAVPADAVSLRQRAWPLVEMMKECLAANEPITWGV
jgi:hypothetical protein